MGREVGRTMAGTGVAVEVGRLEKAIMGQLGRASPGISTATVDGAHGRRERSEEEPTCEADGKTNCQENGKPQSKGWGRAGAKAWQKFGLKNVTMCHSVGFTCIRVTVPRIDEASA